MEDMEGHRAQLCTLFWMAGNRIAILVIQPLHSKAAFFELSCFIFRNVEDRHTHG